VKVYWEQVTTLEPYARAGFPRGGRPFGCLRNLERVLACCAIAGHSSFSKVFPLSIGEMSILRDNNVYTVSQLLEVNDLAGRLTIDENVLLLAQLAVYPHLQHKLRLLIPSMRRAPVVDKFVTPITTATSLFALDKNLSQIFKQQQRRKLHKTIQIFLHNSPTRWYHSATEGNIYKRLQSSTSIPSSLQNKRDCISDIEQNYLDTK
jgi:hypothetical protein